MTVLPGDQRARPATANQALNMLLWMEVVFRGAVTLRFTWSPVRLMNDDSYVSQSLIYTWFLHQTWEFFCCTSKIVKKLLGWMSRNLVERPNEGKGCRGFTLNLNNFLENCERTHWPWLRMRSAQCRKYCRVRIVFFLCHPAEMFKFSVNCVYLLGQYSGT